MPSPAGLLILFCLIFALPPSEESWSRTRQRCWYTLRVLSAPPLRKSDPHLGPLEEATLVSPETGSLRRTQEATCVSVVMMHARPYLRLKLPVWESDEVWDSGRALGYYTLAGSCGVWLNELCLPEKPPVVRMLEPVRIDALQRASPQVNSLTELNFACVNQQDVASLSQETVRLIFVSGNKLYLPST